VAEVKLLKSHVGHKRLWPKVNSFRYSVFYVDVELIPTSRAKTPLLMSWNRLNLLSLWDKDYGHKNSGKSLYHFAQQQLEKAGYELKPDDKVNLISHPRMVGFVFNPITFWLVRDKSGNLRAAICEVHNTFKQTHNYLLHKPKFAPIKPGDTILSEKNLYVSPYTTMGGSYEFNLSYDGEQFRADIRFFENDRHILNTYMEGSAKPINSFKILWVLFRYPFMTFMVVYRIHYQALRLLIKKISLTLKTRPYKYRNNQTTISDSLKK
jgi:DUF1365 family protein